MLLINNLTKAVCADKWFDLAKVSLHISHLYFFIPVCVDLCFVKILLTLLWNCLCTTKLLDVVKVLLYMSNWCFLIPLWINLWTHKLLNVVKNLLHTSHWYFLLPLLPKLHFDKLFCALSSCTSHLNLFPPLVLDKLSVSLRNSNLCCL